MSQSRHAGAAEPRRPDRLKAGSNPGDPSLEGASDASRPADRPLCPVRDIGFHLLDPKMPLKHPAPASAGVVVDHGCRHRALQE
jgi:hypothetical protein